MMTMMKSCLLAIVLVTVVAAGNPESDACTPKAVFFEKCNRCVCANDGSGAICTRRFCPPGDYNDDGTIKPATSTKVKRSVDDDVIVVNEEPETCEPGRKYKVDCNQCFCGETGRLACTRKKCVPKPVQKRSVSDDELPELPEGDCIVGQRYKKKCNICICGKKGIAACTLKECEAHNVVTRNTEHWGPLYKFGEPCEPGKKFYSECNLCSCGQNGRSAICTLKACISPAEQ